MARITRNQKIRQDAEKMAAYMARVEQVNTTMENLRRGAQQQMAHDIPTSASLIAQVRQGKRVSVDVLESMEEWLEAHANEWQKCPEVAPQE